MTSGTLRTILIVGAAVAAVSVAACKKADAEHAPTTRPPPPRRTPTPRWPRRTPRRPSIAPLAANAASNDASADRADERGAERAVSLAKFETFSKGRPSGAALLRLGLQARDGLIADEPPTWPATSPVIFDADGAAALAAATATSTSPATAAWPRPARCSSAAAACRSAGRGARRFTVAELGFGTGLNIAGAARPVARARGRRARTCRSSRSRPIRCGADEAGRALAAWPELARSRRRCCWPLAAAARAASTASSCRSSAPTLDVAVMDAAEALDAWSGARRRLVPRRLRAGGEPGDVDRRADGAGRRPLGARRAGGHLHRRRPGAPRPGGGRLRGRAPARASARKRERLAAILPQGEGDREAVEGVRAGREAVEGT